MREREYIALTSGDHPELGLGELRAVLAVLGVESDPRPIAERLATFRALPEQAKEVAARCGLVKEVAVLSLKADVDLIGTDIDIDQSSVEAITEPYAVRALRLHGHERPSRVEVERWVASVLDRVRPGLKVDLESPETVFRVYVAGELVAGGPLTGERDRVGLARRAPVNRPFKLPSTLQPREARVMVNLSRTPIGARLLDPFSGTGAILMEAASLGYDAIGIEVRTWITRGALRNLKAFNLREESEVVAGDSSSMPLRGGVGGVATDPPYGRSTRVIGPSLVDLVDFVISSLTELLERGRRIVVAYPMGLKLPATLASSMVVERYSCRVHPSLVRVLHVLEV
ncbi:MAG: RsmD family RNA methyltransferase [Thaumarchaeota archaeon]|nr:RsmD family RNA methyltransferase [Candidatus Calditenuaceae archaeon]MDW8187575.1 RsmD family RNA methyltransferase [Nitrososphaerota archaeon]